MADLQTDFVPGSPRLAVDHGGTGPFLMFLHGIGGNRTNWRGQMDAFADAYHVAAWDARGYGGSDDYDGPLDFGAFAADVIRVLDHFGIEAAHFCGLSMGGRILQDVVARFPDRVATLTLCDTTPGFDASMTPEQKAEFVRIRQQPLLEGKEPRDIAPVVARTLLGPEATDDHYEQLVDSMAALHKDSYIKTVTASLDFNRSAELKEIPVPTLLIYGEEDRLTPPDVGRAMDQAIPDSQLVVIDRAGHLCNIENPAAFNAALKAFLDPHRDRAP